MSAPSSAPAALARTRAGLALLTELTADISAGRAGDPGWIDSVLARIATVLRAQTAALYLVDEGDALRCHAIFGAREGLTPHETTDLALVRACIDGGNTRCVTQGPTQRLCAAMGAAGRGFGAVELCVGAGTFDDADRDTLAALAAAAALAMDNARLAEERIEHERLQRELELAAQVQRHLLPRDPGADSPVHGLSRPARGVSGDFYDVLTLPDGRVVFALADVSGKGMNAALIMVKASTLFRSWARRVHEPGRLLARVGAELAEGISMGMFVTMVVGLYDPRTQRVRLANAGHEPPLLRHADGRYTAYPASDPPLGVVGVLTHKRYREIEIDLADGALYLYSDGATEGRLSDGSAPGAEGVQALIEEHATLPAAERLDTLAALYGEDLRDDLTWLVVEDPRCSQRAPRTRRRRSGVLVEQSIPAQSDQLKIVRRLVQAAACQAGASREWAADLALAVDEACQNIIRHGYAEQAAGRIELRVRRDGEQLHVELEDRAPPIRADALRGRTLDDVRPGGLGTYFMQRLTDRVRLLRPRRGPGNRLVLSKKLSADREEPAT